jgi:hypothetical protein
MLGMAKATTGLRRQLPDVADVTWSQFEEIAQRRGQTVDHVVAVAMGVYALRHAGRTQEREDQ